MNKITADDIRYADLVSKRFNKRFIAKPDYIRLPQTTSEVVEAVQDAVDTKRRVVVRSGGHCLESFVTDPAVKVLIDMSLMTRLYFDTERNAFVVEAGVTVGEMYRQLFLKWGLVLPAGEHPGIGVGGHILGGAFGFICREYGLAADYLYAVEVITVDAAGKAQTIVATRESNDPIRELWWAHTGAGGGNFGIVTRYWLRDLPKAPATVTTFRVGWEWAAFGEATFKQLARNFGAWALEHSAPNSPYTPLFSLLFLNHRNVGRIEMKGLAIGDHADRLIEEHLAAVAAPIGLQYTPHIEAMPWLQFALNPFPELFNPGFDNVNVKVKDAFFKQPATDSQLDTAWVYLNKQAPIGGTFAMATYGGKVNTVAPDATASAQRDCILDVACNTGWVDPKNAAASLDWVRNFYKDLFPSSGGVPVPNEQTGGAMINHPDTDLADAAWNSSGIPWYTLYYKENYPRLQKVKAQWDPLNIFYHALSIKAD